MSLSKASKAIIKATVPVLAEHGTSITCTMYKNMFLKYPHLKTIFNQNHQIPQNGESVGAQPKALAQAVHAYAANIDNLSVLGGAIERIAEKHVASTVLPEHYDIVGEQLIGALKEVLGAAATPEIIAAWTEGYQFLADIFINVEKDKMKQKAAVEGGWEGLREFTIQKKVSENNMVCSFYLTPKDGGKVPKSWKPGQYVGIRQYVDEVGMEVTRTYSISNYPGSDSIRLTVKKEQNGTKEGLVSSTLHGMKEGDTLNITMPCGDFVLSPPATETVPIVLLGLGIGVTPIYPLAKQVASTYANPIHVILGARNEDSQALVADFEELKKSHPDKIDLKVCIKSPNKGSPAQTMNFPYIWSQVPHDGDYYFCGPHGWMDELNHGFLASSVSPSNIHFEFFGPTLQLQQ